MRAYYFSHKGKRENNQDYLIADSENGIFIIADGMGGYDYGEIASEISAESCHEYLLENKITDEDQANEMLSYIQDKLKNDVKENPHHMGMGTTLACIQFLKDSVSVMHIGDSRVYYLDSNSKKKFWRTRDDSYVQELIDSKIISEKDAEGHSFRNRLTKSISISRKEKKMFISFSSILNPKENDIFFLCTDGIFDSLSEKSLLHHLREEKQGKEIIEKLELISKELSSDNTSIIYI